MSRLYNCQFEPHEESYRCVRCGVVRPTIRFKNCPGDPLLGDRIKAFAKRLGIKQCGGCKKRHRTINKAHARFRKG